MSVENVYSIIIAEIFKAHFHSQKQINFKLYEKKIIKKRDVEID